MAPAFVFLVYSPFDWVYKLIVLRYLLTGLQTAKESMTEAMPQHQATSDAFIIVQEGSGKIIFSDNEVELQQGSPQLIPANKKHRLQVLDAFTACVILAPDAAIKFL